MHGCGVIICMNFRGFSENLLILWIMLKSLDREKNSNGPNLVSPQVHRRGGGGCSPWAKARSVGAGPRAGWKGRWAWLASAGPGAGCGCGPGLAGPTRMGTSARARSRSRRRRQTAAGLRQGPARLEEAMGAALPSRSGEGTARSDVP